MVANLSEPSCPVRAVSLVHAALKTWRMLYCGKCRGMLISVDIFVELMLALHEHSDDSEAIPRAQSEGSPPAHKLSEKPAADGHAPLRWPGNVIIDDYEVCHLHWLDYDERRRIIRGLDDALYRNST